MLHLRPGRHQTYTLRKSLILFQLFFSFLFFFNKLFIFIYLCMVVSGISCGLQAP